MIKYSYSRLKLFEDCPYSYYLRYIQGEKTYPNPFSDYGKFVHSILEGYYKNEIKDPLQYYMDNFKKGNPTKIMLFGRDITNNYYAKGLNYFENFVPFNGDIIGVEEPFDTEIDGVPMRGFVDLVVKKNNHLYIIDHKSSKPYTGKSLNDHIRQLYIYREAIKEKYGTADVMVYNFFNHGEIGTYFPEEDMENKTKAWIKNTVEKINECKWNSIPDTFYCKSFCDFKKICPSMIKY